MTKSPAMAPLVDSLNNPNPDVRLLALKALAAKIGTGEIPRAETGTDVNNHIHTIFSFSPHSPAKAVWLSSRAGLCTAGIVDHDSVAGAEEFIEAGSILGLPTTVGAECRVDMSRTALAGKRINNTDQDSLAYVVLHGIPHQMLKEVAAFFAPYSEKRNVRTRRMTEKAAGILAAVGVDLDFDRDVAPLSQVARGGSITERHLAYAAAKKMVARFGRGSELLSCLGQKLALRVPEKIARFLRDPENPHYEYDLLGFIKSDFISSFYIDATDECPDVRDFIALAERVGGVSAYAYLGDVTDSATGDKRAQKFEDEYLDTLFDTIADLGFRAVTYMPPRNTPAQLERLRALCVRHGFFQISGVDINSPRQSFACAEMRGAEFDNLRDAAWALIGHELSATVSLDDGMFSAKTIAETPSLDSRVRRFRDIARGKTMKE